MPDSSFGFTGTGGREFAQKYDLPYYVIEGNYPATGALFYSVDPVADPPLGHSVVREVAKLDNRNDGLGESSEEFQSKLTQYATNLTVWYLTPSWLRGTKPTFSWYTPNAASLAAAENTQIVETIRREKAAVPPITGTVWAIGNEPNFFPSITPTEYAGIFTAYYNVIKGEDPTAKVALGELFLHELAPDLRAAMERVLEAEFETAMRDQGYYSALNSAGVYNSVLNTIKSTLFDRFYQYTTPQYLEAVLAALPAGMQADVITLHTYPYYEVDAENMLAQLRANTETTVNAVQTILTNRSISSLTWITEFGNIQPALSESQLAAQTDTLINVFQSLSHVDKWLYYKATGMDQKLALFNDSQEVLTRLASDSSFAPVDGNFSCSEINEVGKLYYLRSHGHICRDLPTQLLSSQTSVTAIEEERFLYRATLTEDTLPVTISFYNLPSWLTADGDSVWGAPDDPISDTSFRIVVSIDDRVDTLHVNLTVAAVNDRPNVTSSLSDTATENSLYQYIATVEDVDHTPSITFQQVPEWLTVYGDTLRGTPTSSSNDAVIQVIGGDGNLADTAELNLTIIHPVVGIKLFNGVTAFSASPNPVQRALHIIFPNALMNATVRIYDSKGKNVFVVKNYMDEHLVWDTRTVGNGIYCLLITADGSRYQKNISILK